MRHGHTDSRYRRDPQPYSRRDASSPAGDPRPFPEDEDAYGSTGADTADTLARSRVVKTLQPGQPGTARWQNAYGERLVCVRYREDLQQGQRHLTVELVMETRPLTRRAKAPPADLRLPPIVDKAGLPPRQHTSTSSATQAQRRAPQDAQPLVSIAIAPEEFAIRRQARAAGAVWNSEAQCWDISLAAVESFGWQDRIVTWY